MKNRKNVLIILLIAQLVIILVLSSIYRKSRLIPENPKLEWIICRDLRKLKLTEQDLLSVKSITINGIDGSARKLDGIERLQNLEHFQLYSGKIDSIESLRNLKKLKYVQLTNNPIKDLSPITGKELAELSIINIKDLDFSPLQNMKISRQLYIRQCGLKDLMQLKGITAEKFILYYNDIEYFPEDKLDWKNAKEINLSYNPISEFDKRDNWVNYISEE